jgi:hypothetical protein
VVQAANAGVELFQLAYGRDKRSRRQARENRRRQRGGDGRKNWRELLVAASSMIGVD